MTDTWQVIETVINAGIGCLLALATWYLYRATRDLATVARRAEDRERDRDKPRVRIGAISGESESGFSVTNTGVPDVTIVQVGFAFGLRAEESGGKFGMTPLAVRRGKDDVVLPQRLRHGDTLNVIYDTATLVDKCRETRLQPVVLDSVSGNHSASWIEYGFNSVGFFDDPGRGLRPSKIY